MDEYGQALFDSYVEAATKRIIDEQLNTMRIIGPYDASELEPIKDQAIGIAAYYHVGGRWMPLVAFLDGRTSGFVQVPTHGLTPQDLEFAQFCLDTRLSESFGYPNHSKSELLVHTTTPHTLEETKTLFSTLGARYEQRDEPMRAQLKDAFLEPLKAYGPLEFTLEEVAARQLEAGPNETRVDDAIIFLQKALFKATPRRELPEVRAKLRTRVLENVIDTMS